MKKLSGLIIIVVFTTSCAHNKIRLSHKYKIDKHENEHVNSAAYKEIEAIDFAEVEEQSIKDSTLETSIADFIFLKENQSSTVLVDNPIKKVANVIKQSTPNKFKSLHFKDFHYKTKQDRKAKNKIGFGITVILVSVGFVYIVFLIWGGFSVFNLVLVLILLGLGIILLYQGIKLAKE